MSKKNKTFHLFFPATVWLTLCVPAAFAAPAAKNEMSTYMHIVERPVANVQDLIDLIMMTRGDFDKYPNEAARAAKARQEGWVTTQNAGDVLNRGVLAYAIVKVFQVTPGLLFRLTGFNRYALRDAQAAGLLSARYNEHGRVSGRDLVGAITAGMEYKKEKDEWQNHH